MDHLSNYQGVANDIPDLVTVILAMDRLALDRIQSAFACWILV